MQGVHPVQPSAESMVSPSNYVILFFRLFVKSKSNNNRSKFFRIIFWSVFSIYLIFATTCSVRKFRKAKIITGYRTRIEKYLSTKTSMVKLRYLKKVKFSGTVSQIEIIFLVLLKMTRVSTLKYTAGKLFFTLFTLLFTLLFWYIRELNQVTVFDNWGRADDFRN